MVKGFVAKKGYDEIITRKKARGYKSVKIDKSVKVPCLVDVSTENIDTEPQLLIKPSKENTKKPIYMFLCKEFGVAGYAANFTNKISVIFCDNGLMLVSLYKGALAIDTDDDLNLFTVDTTTVPDFDRNAIYWVNADVLKSYVAYYKVQRKFVFDFEFMFNIKAGVTGNLKSIKLQHLESEDIDLSLGTYALELAKQPDIKEDKEKEEQEIKIRKAIDNYFKAKKKV